MYAFGKEIQKVEELNWDEIAQLKKKFSQVKLEEILSLLDGFAKEWKVGSPLFTRALSILPAGEETRKTLSLVEGLLKRESLERRLQAEFQNTDVLDKFTKLPKQSALIKAKALGVVLHVTAGNVFLGSLDSLLMGLITKNISLVKVSSQNKIFPILFAESLKDFDQQKILSDKLAILHWKGGESSIEELLKKKVNAIIAWGGEEMIEAYRKDLPPQVKFLDFGPKVSLQVITKSGLYLQDLDAVAEKIVADITPWNQSACASPQNLYLQEGIHTEKLLEEIEKAFQRAPARIQISDDEAVEILKEKYRALYSSLMEGGTLREGATYLVHQERSEILRPSPLNRSLIVKTFKTVEDLAKKLNPFSYYLQSCSYLCSQDERGPFLEELSETGIKRFAPLGTITWGMEGAPHDGRLVLRELVQFIGDERRVETVFKVPPMEPRFDLPGYIFSSGGTTGEPKLSHFSYEDFDFVTDMLAYNFRTQGLKKGMLVANLFVAGNLWSSFIAVDRALEKIGVIQLPIGGLASTENILSYLEKFKPEVVMGIPSLIVSYAQAALEKNLELNVPKVFYAGEALSPIRMKFLQDVWKTEVFGSSGYASVDAGVMGYQCAHAEPGEHHVFSDLVKIEIVEEEAVVTSVARSSMSIQNYHTGDRIEWMPACACGRLDRKFKLLGRTDSLIQVWSCRLNLEDIENSFSDYEVKNFQLVISEDREANLTREKIALFLERSSLEIDVDEVQRKIYENSRDLRDTLSFENFLKDFEIEIVSSGEIPKNQRTGKISLVKDLRR
jgi:phenylacetate-coenzyme A ligase PaaK-like adenylate-forming protein